MGCDHGCRCLLCLPIARFNANEGSDPAKTFEVLAPTLALLTLMPVYLYLLEFSFVTQSLGLISAYLIFFGLPRCIAGANGFTKSFKIPSAYMLLSFPR